MFFLGEDSGSCHSRCELTVKLVICWWSGRIPRNHDLDHGATNHSPSSLESCDVSSPATWRSPDSFWPRGSPWREPMEMGDFFKHRMFRCHQPMYPRFKKNMLSIVDSPKCFSIKLHKTMFLGKIYNISLTWILRPWMGMIPLKWTMIPRARENDVRSWWNLPRFIDGLPITLW